MKKTLAKVLAFVMLFGAIVPNVNIKDALAATPANLVVDMNKGLVTQAKAYPTETPKMANINQVYMSWKMPESETEEYVLTFPVANGNIATFTVDVDGQDKKANVFYSLSGANNTSNMKYKVYTDKTNLFEPVRDIFDKTWNGGGNAEVLNTDPRTGTVYDQKVGTVNTTAYGLKSKADATVIIDERDKYITPMFTIGKDGGFSFQYNEETIYFLWDGTDFKFAVEKVKQGYVYDFLLKKTVGATESAVDVTTGFLVDSVVPKANSESLPLGAKPANYANIIDMNPPSTLKPGADDVSIEITIAKLKYLKNDDPYVDAMPATMILKNKDVSSLEAQKENLIVRIANVNLPTVGATEIIVTDRALKPTATNETTTGADTFTVTIDKLSPGIIYEPTTMNVGSVIGTNPFKSREITFPTNEVYTLMEFEIKENQLIITPQTGYKNLPGKYWLYGSMEDNDNGMKMMESAVTKGAETIAFKLRDGYEYYKIYFDQSPDKPGEPQLGKDAIMSQIIHFTPKLELTIKKPTDFKVIDANTKLVYANPADPTDKTADLKMNLKWDLGTEDKIDKMIDELDKWGAAQTTPIFPNPLEIVYNINRSEIPTDTLSLTPIVEITATITRTAPKTYTIKYTKNTIIGDMITLTETNTIPLVAENKMFYADVTLKTTAKPIALDDGINGFYFPKVYYLNAELRRQTNLNDGALTASPTVIDATQLSLYDNLTLSDLSTLGVPPPQSLTLDFTGIESPKDENGFHVSWNLSTAEVSNFLDNSYGYDTDLAKLTTTLFLSQNYEINKVLDTATPVPYVPDLQVNATTNKTEAHIDLAKYAGAIETLRAGGVIAIEIPVANDGEPREYIIDSADKNQKYYAVANLEVKQWKVAADALLDVNFVKDVSKPSNVATIITKGKKPDPKPDEKTPPAVKFDPTKTTKTSTSAQIYWDYLKGSDLTEAYEYEIVRTTNKNIAPEYLNITDPFGDFWSKIGAEETLQNVEKIGLRTSVDDYIYKYTGAETSINASKDFEFNKAEIFLKDNTLQPNKIYYYYARRVKIIKDASGNNVSEKYSTWTGLSVTTLGVSAPTNLKIDTSRKDYDAQTEAWLSFDAPIVYGDKGSLLAATLGTNFDIQYQIKKDGENFSTEWITMPASALIPLATESAIKGNTHFLYKLTGLSAKMGYSVHVRVYDKLNKDYSTNSNTATFRTDLSQEEYEKEKDTTDWLDYLKEQLANVYKTIYWTTQNNSSTFEAVYRPIVFENALKSATGGTFKLAEGKSSDTIYYIPKQSYDAANAANIGFVVPHGNMEIIVSPKAIDLNTNQTVLDMKKDIGANRLVDYFVKITVRWSGAPTEIDGNKTVSDVANVRLELVSSSQNLADWDDSVFDEIITTLDNSNSIDKYKDSFSNKLSDKVQNEELVKYATDLVNTAKVDVIGVARSKLNSTTDKNFHVVTFDKPVAIVAKNLDTGFSVTGFSNRQGVWATIPTKSLGANVAIYTNEAGVFVFTGRTINIPGLANTEKAGAITGIVAKYGLDDFLGKDVINVKESASKYMVVGSVARMSGAPKEADPFDWLKTNKNLSISKRNMNDDAQTQEALALMMNLYETKTGTKISTLKIRNQAQTASIVGLDEKYKQSVKAAFEVGFYTNKKMTPKASIEIGEILKMLGVLDTKTKIK